MRCDQHDLAAGPDGRCTLCGREDALKGRVQSEREDRTIRGVAKIVVAAMAGLVVFAALLALCDTK
jgi:hypothetical protein